MSGREHPPPFPGAASFVAAARETARRIEALERRGTHAFLAWSEEALVAQAGALSGEAASGPLAGTPVAVKDIIADSIFATTCGSRILEGYRSPFEATALRRLVAAGGLIAGKTNLDEFAMGSSTEHSAFGPTLHPFDPTRVPGGSSGGSAAAVAAGAVPLALGSETGGSVRQPAAFCGVVGIKPTYGRVSRYGLVAFGSSLDQIGVFGRTVRDAGLLLAVISGHDPLDATSLPEPPLAPPPPGPPPGSLAGTVIALPAEYFSDGLDAGIRRACERAVEVLRGLGAVVREVSLPHTRYAVPTYYIIAPAEASSNLARYDGARYGVRGVREEGALSEVQELYRATRGRLFGAEVRRRILLGTYVLSAGYYDAYYLTAQKVRALIRRDFERVFASGVHALFTPTTPGTAFPLGERLGDPLRMYLSDIFVCTANLAGIPALSLPIGRVDGLPVGGQLMGPSRGEAGIVRIAQALEAAADGAAEV